MIFGTCENITPSFLVNKSTGIIEKKAVEIKKESYKKQKTKNNVEVITIAIAKMGQTRERIWEKKMSLEQERINKNHELEKERLKVEKERWAYERQKEEREREKMKMDFDLKIKALELKYQKKD